MFSNATLMLWLQFRFGQVVGQPCFFHLRLLGNPRKTSISSLMRSSSLHHTSTRLFLWAVVCRRGTHRVVSLLIYKVLMIISWTYLWPIPIILATSRMVMHRLVYWMFSTERMFSSDCCCWPPTSGFVLEAFTSILKSLFPLPQRIQRSSVEHVTAPSTALKRRTISLPLISFQRKRIIALDDFTASSLPGLRNLTALFIADKVLHVITVHTIYWDSILNGYFPRHATAALHSLSNTQTYTKLDISFCES